MTTEHAIEISGLTKSYGDHAVLTGVDLSVPSGTIYALLGSNGAGKTTVVRILSTLLRADGGTASVNGHDVATAAGAGPPVDQPDRAVRRGRRDPHRAGEPRAGRPAAPPPGPRRIADDLLARFALTDAARATGGDLLGGHAPPPRHRDEPDRRPARALPRRTDDGARPTVSARGVAGPSRRSRARARRCCSRRSTSTRPSTSPTGSRSSTRAGSSPTAPSPSSRPCSRPPRSSTSRSSRPSRTIFLAIVGHDDHPTPTKEPTMTTYAFNDTTTLTKRSLRHILRSPDTIITTAVTPIAMLLLFVYVFGGAIDVGGGVLRRLPAARHPAHHRRLGDRLHRLPALHRRLGRHLRAVPVDADRPLVRAVEPRADLARRQLRLARCSSCSSPWRWASARAPACSPGSRSSGSCCCSPSG